MVQQAQETVKHQATEAEQEINIQKIIDTHTRELNVRHHLIFFFCIKIQANDFLEMFLNKE